MCQLRGTPLECEQHAHRVERQFLHPLQFGLQLVHITREHGIHHRHETVVFGFRPDFVEMLDRGRNRALGRGIEIERQLLDLGPGQPDIHPGGPRDAFGEVAVEMDPQPVTHAANGLRDIAQFGRVEHRHQRIVALFEQLGDA